MPGWSGSAASRRSRSSKVSAAHVTGSSPSGPVVAPRPSAASCQAWMLLPAVASTVATSATSSRPRSGRGGGARRRRPRRRSAAPRPARPRARPAGPRACRRPAAAGRRRSAGTSPARRALPRRRARSAASSAGRHRRRRRAARRPGGTGRDLGRADPGAGVTRGGQCRREVPVQPQPPRRVQLLVDGVPDQRMGEVVAVGDAVGDDEPGVAAAGRARPARRRRQRRRRADGLEQERALDGRRDVQ